MKVRMHLYIETDIIEAIKLKAQEVSMTNSELVDVALRYYLWKHEQIKKPDESGRFTIGQAVERLIMENGGMSLDIPKDGEGDKNGRQ